MFKKIITALSMLIGLSFGAPSLWKGIPHAPNWMSNLYVNAIIFIIVFMLLGMTLSPYIEKGIKRLIEWVNNLATSNLILGTIGIFVGLLIGYLFSLPFNSLNIPFLNSTLPIIF